MRWLLAFLAPLALLACAPQPQEADPALWKVDGRGGEKAWLFGTIHSSNKPLAWQTPAIMRAISQSDTIMVEVANLADEADVAATFARLAKNEGQPPLSQRIAPNERAALAALLRKAGYDDSDFAAMDTWAAALTLARSDADDDEIRNGVDRAVVAAAAGRRIVELEGAKLQLGLFDALPEADQRDLLTAVVAEASRPERDLAAFWRAGDMTAIEKETRRGLLADPELREALFIRRNRAWAGRIIAQMKSGHLPFVAAGAAHMAGAQGVPAMLAERGYTVTRVE